MIKDSGLSTPWVWDETVGSVLDQTAMRYADCDAVVFPKLGLRWSWRELNRRVTQVAAGLLSLGVEAGDHVGIWSMNVPEWIVSQLAAGTMGAVLVNVNPAYRIHELEDALHMAEVSTLIVGNPFKGSNFVTMVESICPEVVTSSSPDWSSARFPRLKRLIALGDRPGPHWLTWSDLEQANVKWRSAALTRARAVRATDVHNIQFTSGTTGLPKGAMLTHRNVLMNAFYAGERLRYSAADRVCVPVPFYHCFGCVLGSLVCAVYGSALVVPAPSFDAGATLAAIASERCTSVYGVPTMYVAMLEHADFCRFDLKSVRTGIMSGAPCPLPLMEKVVEAMGIREICIGYGQTEASPIITLTVVDDPIEVRVGTVGRPIPGLEVKLVKQGTSAEVPRGETGELCVRGHCVMAGYFNNPAASRPSRRCGRLAQYRRPGSLSGRWKLPDRGAEPGVDHSRRGECLSRRSGGVPASSSCRRRGRGRGFARPKVRRDRGGLGRAQVGCCCDAGGAQGVLLRPDCSFQDPAARHDRRKPAEDGDRQDP